MTIVLANDWAAIETAFITWLESYGGGPTGTTRWADQSIDRPPVPYFTAQVIGGSGPEGLDEIVYAYNQTNDALDLANVGDRRITLQLEAFSAVPSGPGAIDARRMIEQAVAGLRNPNNMAAMNAVGLAFRQPLSGILKMDEVLGQRWERRASIDLEFGYTMMLADLTRGGGGAPYIETIDPVTLTTLGS